MAYNESFVRHCTTQGPTYSFVKNYCIQNATGYKNYYNYSDCEQSYNNCTNSCYQYYYNTKDCEVDYYDYGDCEVSHSDYSKCSVSYSACYDVEATAYGEGYTCSNCRQTTGYNNHYDYYCGNCSDYYYYERA